MITKELVLFARALLFSRGAVIVSGPSENRSHNHLTVAGVPVPATQGE